MQWVSVLEQLKVFKAITGDSDGFITEERLSSVLQNPKAQVPLETAQLYATVS